MLAEIVAGVESGDHAAVEAALLGEVDGAQVRLRVAQWIGYNVLDSPMRDE